MAARILRCTEDNAAVMLLGHVGVLPNLVEHLRQFFDLVGREELLRPLGLDVGKW